MEKTIVKSATTQFSSIEQLTPYLCIQFPDKSTKRVRISNTKLTIGRGKCCHVILNDELISREHCCFWVDSTGVVRAKDLQSTNGSKIDGELFIEEIILPYNRITVGSHQIKLEYKDAEEIYQEELLAVAATSDPLTGISNRKWFEERAMQIITAFIDKNQYIAVIMVDIDHFKKVNDTYGHQTGDVVIKGVAEILNACKRQQDLLARYGGEEFILCLPDSNTDDTQHFCERVRLKIENALFRFGKHNIKVTVSLGGCAILVNESSTLQELIASSDQALYTSKNSGRNRSTISSHN